MRQLQQKTLVNPTNTITYRNAIYQGGINTNKQSRKDFGILYLAKTHQFIVCNNWHNDLLEGQCLFFNDDQKFIYGTWINNIPQGFNVFRMNDILVMTEFRRGRLVKNTPLLIVFEKYNIAAILIVTNEPQGLDDLELQIYNKKQVFTSQDVRQLFDQSEWPQDYFINNQTLIKYISYKLTKNLQQTNDKNNNKNPNYNNPCKLRLVESKYYRFGYDDGLAIIFDEDFNRVSVGSHCKTKVKQFGIAFDRPQSVRKAQKGKIIKISQQNTLLKTAMKNQLQKTQRNAPTTVQKSISKTNLLTGVNFCNKFYKNPSKLFQFYIQNIVNQASIRNLIAGSLTTRKLFQESLEFSRIQSNRGNNNISNEQLFYENQIQRAPQMDQQREQQPGHVSSSRLSKKKIMQDRLRLETIKKEIYESLQHKKNKIQKQIRNEQYQRQIINKDMVGGKSRYQTPQRTLDKSRSRKRIFQQSQKNLKLLKDFTPSRSEPNLTPFKTKMKNRIFNGQQSKVSQNKNYYNPSESQSRNKSKQKTHDNEEDIEIRPGVLKNFNKFSSVDSLDDRDSQVFQRSKNVSNLRNQRDSDTEKGRQHQFSLNDYHVSFQDTKDLNKRSNVSSNKYPSQSGKNHNYVPIDPSEIKQRKRSSKNWISIQDEEQNHSQSQSYKKIYQNRVKNERSQQKNKQREQSQRPKQVIIPETIYFPQKNENRQQDHISHRKSKNSLQVTLKEHNANSHHQYEIQQQKQPLKNRNERNQLSQKYQQIQNRINQKQKNIIKKTIYNQDTFKQNTFDDEFQNTQNLDQSKRSAFKHSNQVYLQQYQHGHSKGRHNEKESKKSVRKAFQYTQNKSTASLIKQQSMQKQNKQKSGASYLQKHKIKKSVQKDIQKSPDRHRCYGRSDNKPYLQNSPQQQQYSKQYSYHNSNKKQDTSYRRHETQYDDTSYKIMRKQISTSIRNYPNRLF